VLVPVNVWFAFSNAMFELLDKSVEAIVDQDAVVPLDFKKVLFAPILSLFQVLPAAPTNKSPVAVVPVPVPPLVAASVPVQPNVILKELRTEFVGLPPRVRVTFVSSDLVTEPAVLYEGAALDPVLLPNQVFALALLKVKLSAGVVVAVATEVVNNGDRLPEEKLVTVPGVIHVIPPVALLGT